MKKQTGYLIALTVLVFSGFFPCPLYGYIGIPCPACGMTRAWKFALRFDFASAFSMHPLFLLPLLVFVPGLRKKWALYSALGVFIIVYAVRMILLFPHTAPMNYNYSGLFGGFIK